MRREESAARFPAFHYPGAAASDYLVAGAQLNHLPDSNNAASKLIVIAAPFIDADVLRVAPPRAAVVPKRTNFITLTVQNIVNILRAAIR